MTFPVELVMATLMIFFTYSKLLALCIEDNRLGVEISADTPSSTGVAGETAVSTSLFVFKPIRPETIYYLLRTFGLCLKYKRIQKNIKIHLNIKVKFSD